jgi:serine-type D-Ala-D-Ala carboxypeptidase
VSPVSDIHPHPAAVVALETLLQEAVQMGVVAGLAVSAHRRGKSVFCPSGRISDAPGATPVSSATTYDLASLTKALCTTTLCMQAIAEQRLSLQDPVQRHLPAVENASLTIEQLLSHSAGFPAHREYFRDATGDLHLAEGATRFSAESIVRQCCAEASVYAPGSKSLYSDIGFILLGAMLERVLEDGLAALFERKIARPLGLPTLGFRPLPSSSLDEPNIAPTELCPIRQRLITGEVHDLNAWVMGGVAGHAGLFGTAADVSAVADALVSSYHGDATPLQIPASLIRRFFAPAGVPGSTWGLGWDHPSPGFSLAGTIVSRSAVGHLGFTGVSLWIDPEERASVTMLSNRVHPHVVDDPRFRALRPAVNDAAFRAVGYPT